MKKIFDWLREQIAENRHELDGLEFALTGTVFHIINEAEAKWEAECCEWKDIHKNIIKSPHESPLVMYKVSLSQFPYCPICGKPIKISEVE